MERSLAHIERITNITPIEKADNLELAAVLGWQCVVKKNEFKVNDKIIYVECDSILPELPEYEFLRKYNFRIKTQKLRGVISQGLILSLSILYDNSDWKNFKEGDDVTELLGIKKYLSKSEQEELVQEVNKSHWTKTYKATKWLWRYKWFKSIILPKKFNNSFTNKVSMTDEPRLMNIPKVLEQFKDKEVYITEKVDYSSGTFCVSKDYKYKGLLKYLVPIKIYQLEVYSRERRRFDYNSVWWNVAKKYNLESILKENPNLVIQGECGDTKVQGNKYGITEPTMWVFNIIDHEKNYHFDWLEISQFCRKYNLQQVPLITKNKTQGWGHVTCKLSDLGSTVQELVEFSKGKSVINPSVEREGIVVRCIENGKKLLSFKVINPNFLIQNDL